MIEHEHDDIDLASEHHDLCSIVNAISVDLDSGLYGEATIKYALLARMSRAMAVMCHSNSLSDFTSTLDTFEISTEDQQELDVDKFIGSYL